MQTEPTNHQNTPPFPLFHTLKAQITPILKREHIKKAALFGSVVRNELRKNSDIDILVQLPADISLLDFIGIKLDLEEILERKVDLVDYDAIKPALKKHILAEQVIIYENHSIQD